MIDTATNFDFLLGDFEEVWEAVAAVPGDIHRGNYLFACHLSTILRTAINVADSESKVFDAVVKQDPRYAEYYGLIFTYLVNPVDVYSSKRASKRLDIAITGATPDHALLNTEEKDSRHLTISGDVLRIQTDQLYRDLKAALKELNLYAE